jgi:uncharacterized protein
MTTFAAPSSNSSEIRIRHRDGDGSKLHAVPSHLQPDLAPAEHVIYEWTPYVVEYPGATRLQTGSDWHHPITTGVFQVTFENQLGLTTIRAYDDAGPLGNPLHVEVIASKFTMPHQSVNFLEQTLTDLFARLATSPFALSAATERYVRESQRSPSLLFAFHFFRHHGDELIRALQAILGRPHQRLTTDPELVRPHAVRQIDREAMIHMLTVSHPVPVALPSDRQRLTPLQRLRPERVWQNIPTETYDTPENRFVAAISRRMLTTIQTVQRVRWYADQNIDLHTRTKIAHVAANLALLTMDTRFASLGPMTVTPSQSRVLQRRDGYRELSALWQRFQRSRQPLFTHLQHAIDLRNIADLYELWVWFELIDQITSITAVTPISVPLPDDFGIPSWRSCVHFEGHGTLTYNRTFTGYSGIRLRPDYTWERADGSLIVLDAKFRMEKPSELINASSDASDSLPTQKAKDDDLVKMHAYRDAILGVRAAVVVYPGTEAMFRAKNGSLLSVDICRLLCDDIEGVGAIPMSPVSQLADDEGQP